MGNLVRIALVIPQAATVTFLLLLAMVTLIEFSDKTIDTEERIPLPDIFMPEHEMFDAQRIIEKPEKPVVDETPPPEIPEQEFEKIDGNAELGHIVAEPIRANLDLDIGARLQATDGEYLPIVKVAPVYPRRALKRGIEGYVIVEYTVTVTGKVENPVVVTSEPEGVFDKAAIKSASRYKYKPRVIDGRPVEVPGVRTRINFNIAE